MWEELTRGANAADSPSFISRSARAARERAMKPRSIAAAALVVGCGLTFAAAVWRGGLGTPAPAKSLGEEPPRGVSTLRPDGGVLPWIAEIGSRIHAPPSPTAAQIPPRVAEPSLTLALSDAAAAPETDGREESTTDDSEPAIGEPAEVDSYLEARDRAAAHSARSH